METLNLNSAKTNNQGAHERAQSANNFAKLGRKYRDLRDSLTEEYSAWQAIMVDCPVLMFTIAFFILGIVEIIISWQMYGDLQSSILDRPSPFLSIFLGLMVVLLGAVVSHYVGKRISSSLFELEVFNMRHQSKYSMPLTEAQDKVRIKTRKHFQIGTLLFIILIIGVLAISFQRVALMGAITGENFGLLQKLLPVIIITLEVFTGIYLSYFFRRIALRRKIQKMNKAFEANKNACAYETRLCNDIYEHAVSRNEQVTYNRELRDTIYRFTHRSQDSDMYVDEIPETRSVKVLVMDEGHTVAGVHVFGILPGNRFTNAIWTNDVGHAVLEWQDESEFLASVMVDNCEHQGPFRANTNIKIDIDRPKMIKIA